MLGKDEAKVWLNNAKHFHHRIMAEFLRKRGWVVFYLEEPLRECKGICWLKLYQDEMSRKPFPRKTK